MANDPTSKSESELIQQAIAVLLGGTSAASSAPSSSPPAASPAASNTSTGAAPRKGRRYSRSEKQAILAEAAAGKTADKLYAQFGVTRETVSRWRRRDASKYGAQAAPGEAAKASPAPPEANASAPERADSHAGYHPHWREALKVWRSRPGLGPAQIANQLHRAGIKITVATTRKILEENGYTPPKAAVKEIEINRYEAVRPRELVHLDFKHFYINRSKVYLLLFQDDFSRFLSGHRMTDSENMKAVIEAFEETVSRYGKMQTVMTDAGSAFYSWNGINRFQRLISEEYGVDHIKAGTPRSNGKIENVNKQIEKEVLDVKRYASLQEAGDAIEAWIRFYNFERTHMGLPKGVVPADRFLYGWNQGEGASPAQQAWTAVLKLALSNLKRTA